MSVAVHKVGNIGAAFIFTVYDQSGTIVDISTATTLQGIFRSTPTGTSKTFNCALLTDGTDGKMQYITVATTDLDVDGDCWQREGYVVIPAVGSFRTNVVSFPVKPNL